MEQKTNIYIAILRGINVGGKRKLLMADLKNLFTELEFTNITTYIQSGNIIFQSDKPDSKAIETDIETAINKNFGFEVPTIVLTKENYAKIIESNPYINKNIANIDKLHITFFKESAPKTIKINFETEDSFKQSNQAIYLNIEGKYHKTKLSNTYFEKQLKTTCTTRNWKTAIKLLELSNSY